MTLREFHYVVVSLLLTMIFEALMTMGMAFKFDSYSVMGWIAQVIIVTFAVTTALRVAKETED